MQTVPKSGDRSVDPSLTEIRITFNKKMKDHSWSWGGDIDQIRNGEPHYLADGKTCVQPVKLEPGKTYTIRLNSKDFHDFEDVAGNPATPYVLQFNTQR